MAVHSGKSTGAIAVNRRARRDYDVLETLEAGLVLTGSEIKSIRDGRVNISQAYAQEHDGEVWLLNMHIAEYHGAGGAFGTHEERQADRQHDDRNDKRQNEHHDNFSCTRGRSGTWCGS